VLVVSAIVSTFPVKTLYLPMTKSMQESFLQALSFFLAALAVVNKGESQFG